MGAQGVPDFLRRGPDIPEEHLAAVVGDAPRRRRCKLQQRPDGARSLAARLQFQHLAEQDGLTSLLKSRRFDELAR